jgi:hypothetical protein
LGMFHKDKGHSRDPDPPQSTIGIIRLGFCRLELVISKISAVSSFSKAVSLVQSIVLSNL